MARINITVCEPRYEACAAIMLFAGYKFSWTSVQEDYEIFRDALEDQCIRSYEFLIKHARSGRVRRTLLRYSWREL